MKRKLSLLRIITVLLLYGLSTTLSQATMITFSFTAEGSGNLDTAVFSNAEFEVIIHADTDDVYYVKSYIPRIDDLSGTIEISGLGTGTFISPLYVFVNQNTNGIGFGNISEKDLIDINKIGAGIDTYDLTTSFGPITDETPFFLQFENVELNTGFLTFADVYDATFTAHVIPEPSTLLLLTLGAIILKRRSK